MNECYLYLTFLYHLSMINALTSHLSTSRVSDNHGGICRDRLGYFRSDDFKVSSCSMCYIYLTVNLPVFQINSKLRFTLFNTQPYFLKYNNSKTASNMTDVLPTVDNETSLNLVCSTLDEDHCSRWKSCCYAAWSCCQQQQNQTTPINMSNICPQTFDGWACWKHTLRNTTVSQSCPKFLSASGQAYKTCGADGHWHSRENGDLEYTDFTRCVDITDFKIYKTALIISVVLNIVGILLILPALTIFIYFRQLRKQQRIQIHINMFISLLVTSVFAMVWDICVKYDRIIHPDDVTSVLHSKQSLCKTLNIIQRLSRATTFFWMTCEGYFLHRLMVNAFLPPKHFTRYIVFGWGLPVFLFVLYAVLRATVADDNLCWISPPDGAKMALEWCLVFIPTILCIVVNFIFLVNILRILLLRMVSHPNEPSNFRKAIRATLVLVPLFGLHQFCLIYRPSSDDQTSYDVFEIFSAFILNTQGIVISLLFCYFNGEVQSQLKTNWAYVSNRYSYKGDSSNRKLSLTTGSATASRRTSISSVQNGGTQLSSSNRNNSGEFNPVFPDITEVNDAEGSERDHTEMTSIPQRSLETCNSIPNGNAPQTEMSSL